MSKPNLIEGIDYYWELVDNLKYRVFTEHYLLKRGFCCQNRCRHCPYGFGKLKENNLGSLEQFNDFVNNVYPSIKQYIINSSDKEVILEDHENYAWEKNPDLKGLFEEPMKAIIKNIEVIYREKEGLFLITIHLK